MPQPHVRFERDPADVLRQLHELRAQDVPTHGGRVLAYVYDPGRAGRGRAGGRGEPDRPARQRSGPDGLPVRRADGGGPGTPGPRPARRGRRGRRQRDQRRHRELHPGRQDGPGRLAGGRGRGPGAAGAAGHAHPAFHKAAHYLDLEVVRVPVDAATGAVTAAAVERGARARRSRSSWCRRRRTRTGCSIRSPRSPDWLRHRGSPATSTPASAAGCCRTPTSRSRGTCPCRG